MSKTRLIAITSSGAAHALVLLAILLQPAATVRQVGQGDTGRSIEVSLVRGVTLSPVTSRSSGEAAGDPAPVAGALKSAVATKAASPSPTVAATVGGSPDSGAPASATVALTDASSTEYQRVLRDHIRTYQYYPDEGRAEGLRGVVAIGFVVRRDGKVIQVWVETSSGHPILDRAALAIVQRAEPLPGIPEVLPDSMSVILPVSFSQLQVSAAP